MIFVVMEKEKMKYKFCLIVDIPKGKANDKNLKKLFQEFADKIQSVYPFDDDDWDFCIYSENY